MLLLQATWAASEAGDLAQQLTSNISRAPLELVACLATVGNLRADWEFPRCFPQGGAPCAD